MWIKPVAGAWIRTWYGNCSEDHDLQAIFVKYTHACPILPMALCLEGLSGSWLRSNDVLVGGLESSSASDSAFSSFSAPSASSPTLSSVSEIWPEACSSSTPLSSDERHGTLRRNLSDDI